MRQIQFGYILPVDRMDNVVQTTYVADLNRALTRISGHFDSAWVIDHLQGDILEGFTTLTYLASRYPQLTFGNTVLCQSFRNPALLAKMSATLHFLSGGRFILGIGAGWDEEEYRAYGYDFAAAGVRVEQLAEALQIIRALWTEPVANFQGEHYQIRDARHAPRPDPTPIIMVGAFRPKMLGLTARYADWWNVSSTGIQVYRRMAATFERACRDVNRNLPPARRSWGGGCACRPTEAKARRLAGDRLNTDPDDDFDFVGTPDQIVDQMRPFIDTGVDYFMLDCAGFPDLTTVELLINEVLPALNA